MLKHVGDTSSPERGSRDTSSPCFVRGNLQWPNPDEFEWATILAQFVADFGGSSKDLNRSGAKPAFLGVLTFSMGRFYPPETATISGFQYKVNI